MARRIDEFLDHGQILVIVRDPGAWAPMQIEANLDEIVVTADGSDTWDDIQDALCKRFHLGDED